jgi:hypothetical protein
MVSSSGMNGRAIAALNASTRVRTTTGLVPSKRRDSGSRKQAARKLVSDSADAKKAGAEAPVAQEAAIAGPNTKPRPNAAPPAHPPSPGSPASSIGDERLRGGMFAPAMPAQMREQHRERACGERKLRRGIKQSRITGRRPMRSDNRPHSGANRTASAEGDVDGMPTTMAWREGFGVERRQRDMIEAEQVGEHGDE